MPHGPSALERVESLLDQIVSISQHPDILKAADQIADLCSAYMEQVEPFAGSEYNLTPCEAKVFDLLMSKRGQICSRQALMAAASSKEDSQLKTLDVHICRLRQKLPKGKFQIEAIWTKGFRMLPEQAQIAA